RHDESTYSTPADPPSIGPGPCPANHRSPNRTAPILSSRGPPTVPKIYTKTGDSGMTGLLGGGRVPKDDLRIEAYGTVDELNAALGVARALGLDRDADNRLAQVQDNLFAVGSALADPDPDGPFHSAIGPGYAGRLEEAIDALERGLPPLTQF